MTFLQAVARQEGFYVEGTRPQRNNNPGDIEYGQFAKAHLATSGDPRFAIFPDVTTGFAAMRALFQAPAYKGLTVEAALNKWAPPVENATSIYIEHVCEWVPCQPTDLIDPLVVL
jgi:hypothetical protein